MVPQYSDELSLGSFPAPFLLYGASSAIQAKGISGNLIWSSFDIGGVDVETPTWLQLGSIFSLLCDDVFESGLKM